MNQNNCHIPQLVAVVGPTASGKSSLAIKIAERYCGTIVCCDSMQIYRGMDIGTAKPTAEEQQRVPHRMFDILSPGSAYSCADYARDAAAEIENIRFAGRLPVLCGGTGLYLDSLLFPRSYSESSGRTEVRRSLETTAAEPDGKSRLHAMLTEIDPVSAAAIHENNVRRVVRALEIYFETGIPKSELDRRSRKNPTASACHALVLGLRYPDRAVLRARIARRVDKMLADGLADEVESLDRAGAFAPLADGAPSTAAQAIGYKEMLDAVRGNSTEESAREAIITATCRYAKRQMTWFGAKPYVNWIDILSDDYDPSERAFKIIEDAGISPNGTNI